MPYIEELGRCVLCPPRCGTNTVLAVIRELYGLEGYNWHLEAQDVVHVLGRAPLFGMPVRDPVDRFVSLLNYFVRPRYPLLDDPVSAWGHFRLLPELAQRTQWRYFNSGWETEVFAFETFGILEWIGWRGEAPRENATVPMDGAVLWTREMVDPILDRVLDHYRKDLWLRERVAR